MSETVEYYESDILPKEVVDQIAHDCASMGGTPHYIRSAIKIFEMQGELQQHAAIARQNGDDKAAMRIEREICKTTAEIQKDLNRSDVNVSDAFAGVVMGLLITGFKKAMDEFNSFEESSIGDLTEECITDMRKFVKMYDENVLDMRFTELFKMIITECSVIREKFGYDYILDIEVSAGRAQSGK